MPAAYVKEQELPAPAAGVQVQPKRVAAKKVAAVKKAKPKGSDGGRKKAEEVQAEKPQGDEDKKGAAPVLKCKERDGMHRTVRRPNTLYNHHFLHKGSYMDPDIAVALVEAEAEAWAPVAAAAAAPKASARSRPSTAKSKPSKPRRRRAREDYGATESGFYYYAGFGGPFSNKRQCRSSMQHDSVPIVKKKEEEDQQLPEDDDASPDHARVPEVRDATNNRADVDHDDEPSSDGIVGITGSDEDISSDYAPGPSSRNVKGGNRGNMRANPGKRMRKGVTKERLIVSLM